MKRKLVLLIGCLVLLAFSLSLIGCGGESKSQSNKEAEQTKPIQWLLFIYHTPESTVYKLFEDFASEVKAKTNGKLELLIRSEGELPYKSTEALKVAGNNSVQMSDCSGGFIGGDSVMANIPYLPYLVTSKEEMLKAWPVLKPYFVEDFGRFGAEPLFVYQWPGQYIWGKGTPIKNLADLKGKKVRTYSVDQQVYLKSFGASPVALTWQEVPEALQRGVIEGMITSAMSVVDSKLDGVAINWGYMANYGPGMNVVAVNSKAMAELPADVKTALIDVANKHQEIFINAMIEQDKDRQETASGHGVTLVVPTAEDMNTAFNAAKSIYDKWAQDKGGKAAEALNAVRATLGK